MNDVNIIANETYEMMKAPTSTFSTRAVSQPETVATVVAEDCKVVFFNVTLEENANYLVLPENGDPETDVIVNFAADESVKNSSAVNGSYSIGDEVKKSAFAIYSADDQSLNFYKRAAVPAEGGQFEGKVVTNVYTGVDTDEYTGGYLNAAPWSKSYAAVITNAAVVDEGIAPVSTASWFEGMTNCISIDVTKLDTSNVTSMNTMFFNCPKVQTLDVGHFDTSNVTDMHGMFYQCGALQNLDTSNWDTSEVTLMSLLFKGCTSLQTVDVSHFDTSNVENMLNMFYGCEAIQDLDVSNFNTSKVYNMGSMFYNCKSLETLDLSDWDVSGVTHLAYSNSWDYDMGYMFNGCSNLTSVGDLSHWNTSNVTNMVCMFSNCTNLSSLDMSNFDVSNVDGGLLIQMFKNCSSLQNLDVNNWDVSNITSLKDLFYGCSSLKTLDLSKWNTSNVTNLDTTFAYCTDLNTIYVGDAWNTSNFTNTNRTFLDCVSLVGGNGTTYDSTRTSGLKYACIDTAETPGYLTYKGTNNQINRIVKLVPVTTI